MSKLKIVLAAVAMAASFSFTATASAAISSAPVVVDSSMLAQVSGGCGPNGWRGSWGHCRYTPYYRPLPNGYYQPYAGRNGCPPGYWRGPWGHCRNTSYHGRLPNGGWK